MLFSSVIFLYLFLPITLLGYYLSPGKIKNYWLLLASLVFFAWGGVSFVAILLLSIIINFLFGILISNNLSTPQAYRWVVLGVTVNLLLLGVFKYTNFFIQNINEAFRGFHLPEITEPHILLPIGISFYTFHSLSYLIDIYREKTEAQKNIFNLSLYIAMFSQLIAGPIIRYSDVWLQLSSREHSLSKFSSGVERFLIGLGKKVLLANTFAKVADSTFSANYEELGGANAWLGILCYSLQIYCDFAGYSDMAIGLGRMFGFEFKENFNFPYIASSVKEFWRRWHISLSSFFRDYLYIPLGGNQISNGRTYLNLFIVFFLTGFWHGASWSFVVWGLFHGLFMVIERLGFEKVLNKAGKPFSTMYTLLVVIFAWVLFRADSLSLAIDYWRAMFHFSNSPEQLSLFFQKLNVELVITLLIALAGAFGLFEMIRNRLNPVLESENTYRMVFSKVFHITSVAFYSLLLFLCTLYLIAGTYNPFIYYRF